MELFGDAVMILEFAHIFKSIFDFKQFFPKGFTWCKYFSIRHLDEYFYA